MNSARKIVSLLLALLMVLAPVSAVLASSNMSHGNSKVTHASEIQHEMQIVAMHHHDPKTSLHASSHHTFNDNLDSVVSISLDNTSKDNNHDTNESHCQDECANCVFCSTSTVTNNYLNITVQNTSILENLKSFLTSIDINVDLRPPRNS